MLPKGKNLICNKNNNFHKIDNKIQIHSELLTTLFFPYLHSLPYNDKCSKLVCTYQPINNGKKVDKKAN